jgi:PAS domain S-box-containing protein
MGRPYTAGAGSRRRNGPTRPATKGYAMRQSENHLLSEMNEELQFEKLLIDISTHFVNLPADRIDDDIKEAQHRICKYLDLDRSAIWQLSNKKPGEVLLTHVHQPPEVRFPGEKLDAKQAFPWVLDQVLRNGIVAISSPSELPPEAARDRKSFQDWGVRSSVVVPLSIGGKVVGALSFARLRGGRDWPVYVIERFLIVAQVFANALVRKQAEESVRERLELESLLVDISTRFVNLPSEQIDGEIEDAHRRVCECFGLDFSALWQLSIMSPRNYTLTHSYRLVDGPALPERMTADEYFPWCLERVGAGEVIAISTENSPAEAARDQEVWRHYGIKSSLVIPLSAGGEPPIGAVSFNTMKAERTWPEPIVKQLQLVAQIFANALARKYADAELRKSEARLSLATNAAGVGLWIMEIASGCVWVTPKTRELLHLAPEEDLFYETFLKTIHPEDRERIDQEVVQVIQSGEKLQIEYRIVLSDGSTRWIAASGQLYPGSTGEPESLMGVSVDISERNKQMQEIVELKCRLENQVATTEATVLILGETGTGKGLMANAIHQLSARRDRPLITVNCSALPQNLIESELFGREKGAFTGAHTRQAGRFEVADGGTIFLDEIGEMPLELQAKLLRVLQEGEFERLGSAKTVRVDVRVIAATSRDLRQEVQTRRFREDLYYRLNVFPISIPPLRQRSEDIPLLARYFVEKYGRKMRRHVERIPETTIKMFLSYDWPGNVRELEHVVERGVILSTGRTFRLAEQLRSSKSVGANDKPLKDLASAEREHILRVLQETGWRIDGPSGAAAILKLHPSTLRFRIKKLGIRRPV